MAKKKTEDGSEEVAGVGDQEPISEPPAEDYVAPEETAGQTAEPTEDVAVPVVEHLTEDDVRAVIKDLKVLHAAVRWLAATRSPTEQAEFYLAFPTLKR